MGELGNYSESFSCNKSETKLDTEAPACTCVLRLYLGSNPVWSMALVLSKRSLRREEKNVWGFVWGKIKEIIVLKKGEIGISLAAVVAWEHFKLPWLVSFNWKSPTCLIIPHLGIWLPAVTQPEAWVHLDTHCVSSGGPGALWQAGVQVLFNSKCMRSSWTRNPFWTYVLKMKFCLMISMGPRDYSKGAFSAPDMALDHIAHCPWFCLS